LRKRVSAGSGGALGGIAAGAGDGGARSSSSVFIVGPWVRSWGDLFQPILRLFWNIGSGLLRFQLRDTVAVCHAMPRQTRAAFQLDLG